jgi:hypothetical protein
MNRRTAVFTQSLLALALLATPALAQDDEALKKDLTAPDTVRRPRLTWSSRARPTAPFDNREFGPNPNASSAQQISVHRESILWTL